MLNCKNLNLAVEIVYHGITYSHVLEPDNLIFGSPNLDFSTFGIFQDKYLFSHLIDLTWRWDALGEMKSPPARGRHRATAAGDARHLLRIQGGIFEILQRPKN